MSKKDTYIPTTLDGSGCFFCQAMVKKLEPHRVWGCGSYQGVNQVVQSQTCKEREHMLRLRKGSR